MESRPMPSELSKSTQEGSRSEVVIPGITAATVASEGTSALESMRATSSGSEIDNVNLLFSCQKKAYRELIDEAAPPVYEFHKSPCVGCVRSYEMYKGTCSPSVCTDCGDDDCTQRRELSRHEVMGLVSPDDTEDEEGDDNTIVLEHECHGNHYPNAKISPGNAILSLLRSGDPNHLFVEDKLTLNTEDQEGNTQCPRCTLEKRENPVLTTRPVHLSKSQLKDRRKWMKYQNGKGKQREAASGISGQGTEDGELSHFNDMPQLSEGKGEQASTENGGAAGDESMCPKMTATMTGENWKGKQKEAPTPAGDKPAVIATSSKTAARRQPPATPAVGIRHSSRISKPTEKLAESIATDKSIAGITGKRKAPSQSPVPPPNRVPRTKTTDPTAPNKNKPGLSPTVFEALRNELKRRLETSSSPATPPPPSKKFKTGPVTNAELLDEDSTPEPSPSPSPSPSPHPSSLHTLPPTPTPLIIPYPTPPPTPPPTTPAARAYFANLSPRPPLDATNPFTTRTTLSYFQNLKDNYANANKAAAANTASSSRRGGARGGKGSAGTQFHEEGQLTLFDAQGKEVPIRELRRRVGEEGGKRRGVEVLRVVGSERLGVGDLWVGRGA
ncbi:hypothetical protein ACLMJK_008747 [Lecanora helva]